MNKLAYYFIRLYQVLFGWKPKTCRFTPTCSEYGLEAYRKHTFFRATVLTLKRILACHPFNKHCGHDPVPD